MLVLVNNLPPESAYNTAVRNSMPESELMKGGARHDPVTGKWSSLELLLATLIDEVRNNTWVYVQAHNERSIPKPTPIRRPGIPSRQGKIMSLADAQKIDPRLRGMSEEEAQATLDRLIGRGRG